MIPRRPRPSQAHLSLPLHQRQCKCFLYLDPEMVLGLAPVLLLLLLLILGQLATKPNRSLASIRELSRLVSGLHNYRAAGPAFVRPFSVQAPPLAWCIVASRK